MISKEFQITGEDGLKARTAALFVQIANQFDSQILVEYENKKINAKSIMGVLSLGVRPGDSHFVIANGKDENEAVQGIGKLIENNFEL